MTGLTPMADPETRRRYESGVALAAQLVALVLLVLLAASPAIVVLVYRAAF